MSPKNMNDRQLALLRRIADGVVRVTSHEYHLATTVYALRNRGLVATTRTGGGGWTASITGEGRYYIAHGNYRAGPEVTVTERSKLTESDRKPPGISGDDLIQRLVDAGGSLHIPDLEPAVRAAWRRAIHAAANGGKLPAGMRLWHTGRDKGDLVVRLVVRRALETTARHKATPIPVPERLIRPHEIVARIKELSKPKPRPSGLGRLYTSSRDLGGLDVSRPSLGRALRILQALITEAERRGYGAHLDDRTGDPRVCITVKGHQFAVSIREKDGVLRVVLPSAYAGRRLWSDGIRAAVEDKLGDLLANIESRAEEAEQRRLERERREEERRRAWEQEMERARARYAEDLRAAFIRDQVAAWELAADIRSFCSAATRALGSRSEEAETWLRWAIHYADDIDPLSGALVMPQTREPSPDELTPYLRGWNPYGPI